MILGLVYMVRQVHFDGIDSQKLDILLIMAAVKNSLSFVASKEGQKPGNEHIANSLIDCEISI